MAVKWLSDIKNNIYPAGVEIPVATDGQTDFTFYPPYIMGMDMLDVYVNGIRQQKGVFVELTSTSIRYTDTTLPLVAGDVIGIRFHVGSINLGNIRVVQSYTDLAYITNPIQNEIALVINKKSFYIYKYGVWEEFYIPFTTQNLGVLFEHEKYSITDITQHTYNTVHPFPMGTSNLLVFIDGVKVDPDDYVEIDNYTITFNSDLPVGSNEIEFLIANTDSWYDCNSHDVHYAYDVLGNITEESISHSSNLVEKTTFTYDAYGNINTEVVEKNSKVITKTYTYDANGNITDINIVVS